MFWVRPERVVLKQYNLIRVFTAALFSVHVVRRERRFCVRSEQCSQYNKIKKKYFRLLTHPRA
jgi:hypothetical protein